DVVPRGAAPRRRPRAPPGRGAPEVTGLPAAWDDRRTAPGDPPPANPPPKVLLVSSFGVVGGAERYALRMLDGEPGIRVSALLLGPGPLESELARRGVPPEVWPTGRRPADLARPAVRLPRLLRRSVAEVVW